MSPEPCVGTPLSLRNPNALRGSSGPRLNAKGSGHMETTKEFSETRFRAYGLGLTARQGLHF